MSGQGDFIKRMCLIGGLALFVFCGFLLIWNEAGAIAYLTASDKQTVTAEYVSSQTLTRHNKSQGRDKKYYRITRQYTVNGETYTYESEERRNSTAPVETEVYRGKDGSYHARGKRTLTGDVIAAVICISGMGAGIVLFTKGFGKRKEQNSAV